MTAPLLRDSNESLTFAIKSMNACIWCLLSLQLMKVTIISNIRAVQEKKTFKN